MIDRTTWAETLDDMANPVPTAEVLATVRRILRKCALPATVFTLQATSKFGCNRLQSALHTLEAHGEVEMNKRGDTVFAVLEPNRPDGGNTMRELN